ncbi:hypothetical protein [Falsiroseomonas tokyonensis]|uniref:Uncharacterized protein n=1 Tax=Falsiroseomonas tokyonensis TaxID=430521 RepID=A0ABV7BZW5_9PROT|nr:hypothetical protein [Falsiroseomonas tokyonensis]MBU8540802.1 hypothetical protein [Falsiroseomonas tokyonensis]
MQESGLAPYGLYPEAVIPDGYVLGSALERPALVAGGAPRGGVGLVTMTARSPSAVTATPPVVLVTNDALGANVAVTRAHTPSGVTSLERLVDGIYAEIAQNQPRYRYETRSLRVSSGGTNTIRNPRGEGATAPTTVPTNWSVSLSSGLTTTVISTQFRDGVPTVTLRVAGTSTGTFWRLVFDTTTAIVAAAGQTWTASLFCRVASAPNPPNTYAVRFSGRSTGGGVEHEASSTAFTPTATLGRYSGSTTLANASTARIQQALSIGITNGVAYDFTIEIGAPDLKQSPLLSSATMPPTAAPQASTRGIDVPIWTPSAFPPRGCIVLLGTLDALAGVSALGLLQLDGGTDSNRLVARVAAGGGQPEMLVITGGVTTATLTLSDTLAAATPFRALVAWSPGGVRFGTSTGGVVSAGVALPPGLLRGLLGHANAAGTLPMGGELVADFFDTWPSEAEAAALLAA